MKSPVCRHRHGGSGKQEALSRDVSGVKPLCAQRRRIVDYWSYATARRHRGLQLRSGGDFINKSDYRSLCHLHSSNKPSEGQKRPNESAAGRERAQPHPHPRTAEVLWSTRSSEPQRRVLQQQPALLDINKGGKFPIAHFRVPTQPRADSRSSESQPARARASPAARLYLPLRRTVSWSLRCRRADFSSRELENFGNSKLRHTNLQSCRPIGFQQTSGSARL